MIVGFGIDVVEVARLGRILEGERGKAFVKRVFTKSEQGYCDRRKDSAARYAARFAAKEAVTKALGAPRGLRWTDIEVRSEAGPPRVVLAGTARKAAKRRAVEAIHLTLTHDAGVAVAAVVLESLTGGRGN